MTTMMKTMMKMMKMTMTREAVDVVPEEATETSREIARVDLRPEGAAPEAVLVVDQGAVPVQALQAPDQEAEAGHLPAQVIQEEALLL